MTTAPTATGTGTITTAAEHVFRLPDLGEGLTEAEILEWRVADGDVVAVDQIVVEVETAKAAVDVPVPVAGTVVRLHAGPGTVVEVGQPLLTVAAAGEDLPRPAAERRAGAGADGPAGGDERRRETYREEERAGSGNVLVGYGTNEGGPSRRRAARRAARAAALAAEGREDASGTAVRAGDGAATETPGTGRDDAAGRRPSGIPGRAVGTTEVPGSAAPEGTVRRLGTGSAADAAGAGYGAAPAARLANDVEDAAAGARGPAGAGGRAEAPRVISPVVRRLAREHGLDVAAMAPSGPGGVLLRRDVDAAIAATPGRPGGPAAAPSGGAAGTPGLPSGIAGRAAGPAATDGAGSAGPRAVAASAQVMPAVPPGPAPTANATHGAPGSAGNATGPAPGAGAAVAGWADEPVRIPLRGLRRAVADKLARSRREIPDATTWVDVDATPLMEFKDELRRACPEAGVGTLALLARICIAGLRRHPELNARVDTERAEIVRLPRINLGFAAQTDRGLVVPVVHDAHRLTLAELAERLRELTLRAREGTLAPRDLTGGTFTLNNYGVFGVDGSTPIINHPEAGLLGVGRIVDRPWGVDGELRLRKVAQLSFTFDHRVCDGGVAGGFLRFVADCVERPQVLITNL